MDIKEIQAMVGTEFPYYDTSGNIIPAIVAAFDLKVGFTCLATNEFGSNGRSLKGSADKNGNICLIGVGAVGRNEVDFLAVVIPYAKEIKNTGEFYVANHQTGFGNPSCSF